MRAILFILLICWAPLIRAQFYIVNTEDDTDDGTCDAVHCSLREAINASETDGVPSVIQFNIPGSGQHAIAPLGSFPDIQKDDLTIIGKSQPGGPGSVVIDLNNRDLSGNVFWKILGQRINISGIDFADFLFSTEDDHLLQIGDSIHNAIDCKIKDCSFNNDNSFQFFLNKSILLSIYHADNLVISNCNFGTDYSKSSIYKLNGFVQVEQTQTNGKVSIDSNVFVNKNRMIKAYGGDLHITHNIFGALDTTGNVNFLNPEYGIYGDKIKNALIQDNYFFGFNFYAIAFNASNGVLVISKNTFNQNANESIVLEGNNTGRYFIVDNTAAHGLSFLDAISNPGAEFDIERNKVSDYDFFLLVSNLSGDKCKRIRYIDNIMSCINLDVVTISENGPGPLITEVTRNQIKGLGMPGDSIVIYYNERIGCSNANCQAGVELGRTKAETSGSWTLDAGFPQGASISAYQFDGNASGFPDYYSGFSPCSYLITNNDNSPGKLKKEKISVNQNPVTDKLYIQFEDDESRLLEVYNSCGQKVVGQSHCIHSIEWNINNWVQGVYYLKFTGKQDQSILKILKE